MRLVKCDVRRLCVPIAYSNERVSEQSDGIALGFGVWSLGFGAWGLGFGVCGLGFGFCLHSETRRACEEQLARTTTDEHRPETCHVLRVTCYVLRVTCYVLRDACHMLRVT